MDDIVFTKEDMEQMNSMGISPEQAYSQIKSFRKGFLFSILIKPCTVGEGIVQLNEDELDRLSGIYSKASESGRSMKFVPASGAATRMFKSLHWINENYSQIDYEEIIEKAGEGRREYEDLLRFTKGLRNFAFYDDLKSAMLKEGLDLEVMISKGEYKNILDHILTPAGINLSGLPKGLIPFHRYGGHARTPFEEHLVEANAYTMDGKGNFHIHFTISREHERLFKAQLENLTDGNEDLNNKALVSFSYQDPSTDIIAVDMDNRPFRDGHGRLVFRPGGHGALLDNLNDLQGDIVFIKNIDNVVPDHLKRETYVYKKALGGYLIELQEKIFGFLASLNQDGCVEEELEEMFIFTEQIFTVATPGEIKNGSKEKKIEYLFSRFNRPLRVCGMVRNVGEPGGGPFWVRDGKGIISPQIVESSQVDKGSMEQKEIWESSTHFNPVDLVCGVKDYQGNSFDLRKFVDPESGFISIKSKEGRELKALELPGLWNGSMAYWNSVFVEVPIITFNPVKTVLDLLREEHQPVGDH